MMKREGASRGGGTVSTVDSVDSAPGCESECTAVRCVRQLAAVTEDVLHTLLSTPCHDDQLEFTHAAKTPVRSCTSNAERP